MIVVSLCTECTESEEVSHRATNNIIIAQPVLFSRLELHSYERDILANPRATEHDASEFFEQFPHFLYLNRTDMLRREVMLFSADGRRKYRCDFFSRRIHEENWDIIELKSPQSRFIVGRNGHFRPSASVTTAQHQAEDYRDLIDSDPSVREKLLRKGLRFHRPEIVVIVGQEREDVDPIALKSIRSRLLRQGIEAWSYTAIFEFAKSIYQSSAFVVIPVVKVRKPIDILAGWFSMETTTSEVEADAYALTTMIPDAFLDEIVEESTYIPTVKLSRELNLPPEVVRTRVHMYRQMHGYTRSEKLIRERLK